MNILIDEGFELNDEEIKTIEGLGHNFVRDDYETVEFWLTSPQECNEGHLKYPNLEYVQLRSAGFDSLDLKSLNDRGITVMNARGVHSPAISEYILTYILSIYKRTFHYKELQDKREWNTDKSLETLENKRVVFLGAGSIAKKTALLLKPFGAITVGLNSDGRRVDGFTECMSLEDGLTDLASADVVVNTLPSNEATYRILDFDVLNSMKECSLLINIGRGDTIDEEALLSVLDDRIHRVVLDVFEEEPLPKESSLWTHPKIIVTPHISYSSPNRSLRHSELFMEQMKRLALKKSPVNIINQ